MYALGIDTSNYTTSAALVDLDSKEVVRSVRRLLPVKSGECGLRQSDAVFHHTAGLPEILGELFDRKYELACVGVSHKPTDEDGSYMPCFLAGVNAASAVSVSQGIALYRTTHQIGHILCATVLNGNAQLLEQDFFAFHISGGTTQLLLCRPDREKLLRISVVAESLDLKAGQGIDRVGAMLKIDFPAGRELEKLALQSDKFFTKKPASKGMNCCLSGLENIAAHMLSNHESRCDVAKFAIDYIGNGIENMKSSAVQKYGDLPTVYTGGVMSDSILIRRFSGENTYFAGAKYSSDNACGIALYAAMQHDVRAEHKG